MSSDAHQQDWKALCHRKVEQSEQMLHKHIALLESHSRLIEQLAEARARIRNLEATVVAGPGMTLVSAAGMQQPLAYGAVREGGGGSSETDSVDDERMHGSRGREDALEREDALDQRGYWNPRSDETQLLVSHIDVSSAGQRGGPSAPPQSRSRLPRLAKPPPSRLGPGEPNVQGHCSWNEVMLATVRNFKHCSPQRKRAESFLRQQGLPIVELAGGILGIAEAQQDAFVEFMVAANEGSVGWLAASAKCPGCSKTILHRAMPTVVTARYAPPRRQPSSARANAARHHRGRFVHSATGAETVEQLLARAAAGLRLGASLVVAHTSRGDR
ncbi:hypothetical protein BC830DRAFT_1081475, partial [Chytriomyces sp. MP71]